MRAEEQSRRPLQDCRMSTGWDLRKKKKGGGVEDNGRDGWRGMKSKEDDERSEA